MPTITIETTPESLAQAVASLLPDDRARFDAALRNFATARNVPDEEEVETEEDYRLTNEDKAALARSAADLDAGRTHSAEEIDVFIRERYGWTAKK